jgi:hypothetical protein
MPSPINQFCTTWLDDATAGRREISTGIKRNVKELSDGLVQHVAAHTQPLLPGARGGGHVEARTDPSGALTRHHPTVRDLHHERRISRYRSGD